MAPKPSSDLLELYGTDATLAREGVWHTLAPGVCVCVARWNNPLFQRALEDELEERSDGLDEDEDRAVMARVLAQTILTDWQGIVFEGEELPYSPANAEKVLADPRMRDFRLEVTKRAQRAERYRIKRLDDDRKNSSKRSGGS